MSKRKGSEVRRLAGSPEKLSLGKNGAKKGEAKSPEAKKNLSEKEAANIAKTRMEDDKLKRRSGKK